MNFQPKRLTNEPKRVINEAKRVVFDANWMVDDGKRVVGEGFWVDDIEESLILPHLQHKRNYFYF